MIGFWLTKKPHHEDQPRAAWPANTITVKDIVLPSPLFVDLVDLTQDPQLINPRIP